LNDHRGKLAFIQNLEESKDENENSLLLLLDQLVNKNWDNIEVDNRVNSLGELRNVYHGLVCV